MACRISFKKGIPLNKNQLIYLGSPYTHKLKKVMKERYEKALYVTANLLNQGYHVISPIVHCHPLSVKFKMMPDFEFWKRYNFAILSKCEVLLVLQIDGWLESKGLQGEIEYAKRNNIIIETYFGF